MKLSNYYELNKSINESKCVLSNESLDYLESLLNFEISVLDKDYNDSFIGDYLCQLKFFKDLVLYNLYKGSVDLYNVSKKDYIVSSDFVGRFNIDYVKNDVHYNIYSLKYNDDLPNIELYSNCNKISYNNIDDSVLKYVEDDMIINSEKERILDRFLYDNNLSLSDFDDSKGIKVKKYPYANIYIK